jgi:hypothetical protein
MRTKRIVCSLLLFLPILFCQFCGEDSPTTPEVKKKAILSLAVDETPILVTWDRWVELWYMKCYITCSESNGVGVTASGTMWFIWENRKYEEQSIEGIRLRAYGSETLYLKVGTEYHYDEIEFKVSGTDDNGYSVNLTNRYDLHYVGLD